MELYRNQQMAKDDHKSLSSFCESRFGMSTSSTKTQQNIQKFLNSTPLIIFISILTIYTIFAMDIDSGFFNRETSTYFSICYVITIMLFIIQMFLTLKSNNEYICQLYFWMDLLSTFTMIFQLIWIQDGIFNQIDLNIAYNFIKITRICKLAKISTRSSKIIKFLNIFYSDSQLYQNVSYPSALMISTHPQLFDNKSISLNTKLQYPSLRQDLQNNTVTQNIKQQLSNSLKPTNQKITRPNVNTKLQAELQKKWEAQNVTQTNNKNQQSLDDLDKGTNIGKILKFQTQKNVVIMVMTFTIVIPLLNASTWFNKVADIPNNAHNYIDIAINNLNESQSYIWMTTFINLSLKADNPMIYFSVNNTLPTNFQQYQLVNTSILSTLRQIQQIKIATNSYKIIYSQKKAEQMNSWLNIARNATITILLLLSLLFFMRDLQMYALTPLQKMSYTVEKVWKNPFSLIYDSHTDNDLYLMQIDKKQEHQLQTNILSNLLIKIASLLALGVGETPSGINQMESLTFQNEGSGVEIRGVFMVFQVAHIEQIIEHLQNQACLYINRVLQIFHESAIQNGGYVYHQDETYSLICWPISSHLQNSTEQKQQQKRKISTAFLAYVKFHQKLLRDFVIKKYDYLNKNIQDFQLHKTHVGIRYGSAYCGPIGSEFKISLRAMGNDVTIAKTLCRIAKKYKLGHLFDSSIYKFIPYLHNITRKIDEFSFIEILKDQTQLTQVYTAQLWLKHPPINEKQKLQKINPRQIIPQSEHKLRKRMNNIFKHRTTIIQNPKLKAQLIQSFSKILLKKSPVLQQWLQIWKQSYINYQQGQWIIAKNGFLNSKQCCPFIIDYPTFIKLNQIGNRDQPLSTWKYFKNISLTL